LRQSDQSLLASRLTRFDGALGAREAKEKLAELGGKLKKGRKAAS